MRRETRGKILAGAGALAAVAFLTVPGAHRLVVKPVPVLCLAAWVRGQTPDAYARRLALGLLLSAVGDVALEAGLFAVGLSVFLVAHLAYIAAFLADTRRRAALRALPFAAWGLGVYALLPRLGSMAAPVGAYVAVICAMMWRAAARLGGPPGAALALAGAVSFAASDTLIALDRFRAPIPGVRLPVMLLYWAGQFGIAASAVRRPRA
jgi:uncharacterized membrane protein YhhN